MWRFDNHNRGHQPDYRQAFSPPSPPPPFAACCMSAPKSSTVTKKELVHRIAEETGHTKVVVKEVVQLLLDTIIDELARGKRIEFREFGVFEVRSRALEKVVVPEKRVVKFKVGRKMRDCVCSPIADEPRREAPKAPPETLPPTPPPSPPPSNSPF